MNKTGDRFALRESAETSPSPAPPPLTEESPTRRRRFVSVLNGRLFMGRRQVYEAPIMGH